MRSQQRVLVGIVGRRRHAQIWSYEPLVVSFIGPGWLLHTRVRDLTLHKVLTCLALDDYVRVSLRSVACHPRMRTFHDDVIQPCLRIATTQRVSFDIHDVGCIVGSLFVEPRLGFPALRAGCVRLMLSWLCTPWHLLPAGKVLPAFYNTNNLCLATAIAQLVICSGHVRSQAAHQ